MAWGPRGKKRCFERRAGVTLLDITGEVTDVDVSAYASSDFVTNQFIDPAIGIGS